jgi:hypothetical protein
MKRGFDKLTSADEVNNEEFQKELQGLLNKYCMDNYTATPDYILAEYLMDTITNYRRVAKSTHEWFSG